MYESYFGLSGKPFSLLPEANYLFFSKRHQHIVNILEYGMQTEAAFIAITGDVGAGKTTIIRHFLSHVPSALQVGLITNPSKRFGSLLGWISSAFDLDHHGDDEAKMYNGFVEFLLAQYAKGLRTVLIIDEAQNLSAEMLEELRMLSNVNNEQDILLQIILAGQPELLETLNRQDLRQFVQRIGAHGHLTALSARETLDYIHHRLTVVGGKPELFEDHAAAAVHYFSGGVPRLINLLCDQALLYAYAENQTRVDGETVLEVAKDRNTTGLTVFTGMAGKEDGTLVEDIARIIEEMKKDDS